jgi:hypothetical protein
MGKVVKLSEEKYKRLIENDEYVTYDDDYSFDEFAGQDEFEEFIASYARQKGIDCENEDGFLVICIGEYADGKAYIDYDNDSNSANIFKVEFQCNSMEENKAAIEQVQELFATIEEYNNTHGYEEIK